MTLTARPTEHTPAAVAALRAAARMIPCPGSICAALDAADPHGRMDPGVYAEAVAALDVAARVFGHDFAYEVGAHQLEAVLLTDVAVYHLTAAQGDVPPALAAFRRAAGPLLERTRG
jgi:hypothetical protein